MVDVTNSAQAGTPRGNFFRQSHLHHDLISHFWPSTCPVQFRNHQYLQVHYTTLPPPKAILE